MSSIINLKEKRINTRTVVVEPILWNIKSREENFTIIATGKSGGGKSAAIMELLHKCDPTFNAKRVAFNAVEFINIIKDQNLKPGSAVLFDEIGESIGARSFMARQQRDLLIYMQNYRIKRLIVGFTIPHTSFTDVQLRRMAHAYLEYISKKKSKMRTYWKYKLNQYRDNRFGQPMFMFPVVRLSNGKRKRIPKVSFKHPPKNIWDEYIPKKMANIARLELKMLATKELKEEVNKEAQSDMAKEFLKHVQEEPINYIHYKNGMGCIRRELSHAYLKKTYGFGPKAAEGIRVLTELELRKDTNSALTIS